MSTTELEDLYKVTLNNKMTFDIKSKNIIEKDNKGYPEASFLTTILT